MGSRRKSSTEPRKERPRRSEKSVEPSPSVSLAATPVIPLPNLASPQPAAREIPQANLQRTQFEAFLKEMRAERAQEKLEMDRLRAQEKLEMEHLRTQLAAKSAPRSEADNLRDLVASGRAVLQPMYDALFEENTSLRTTLATDLEKVAEHNKKIKLYDAQLSTYMGYRLKLTQISGPLEESPFVDIPLVGVKLGGKRPDFLPGIKERPKFNSPLRARGELKTVSMLECIEKKNRGFFDCKPGKVSVPTFNDFANPVYDDREKERHVVPKMRMLEAVGMNQCRVIFRDTCGVVPEVGIEYFISEASGVWTTKSSDGPIFVVRKKGSVTKSEVPPLP